MGFCPINLRRRAFDDPRTELTSDVWWRSVSGAGAGLLIWAGLVLGLGSMQAKRYRTSFFRIQTAIWHGTTEVPWRAILITLAVILAMGAVAALTTHYHVLGTDKVGQDVLYLSLKVFAPGLLSEH